MKAEAEDKKVHAIEPDLTQDLAVNHQKAKMVHILTTLEKSSKLLINTCLPK